MRMLLPTATPDLTDADLDEAYAWPTTRPWLRVNMVATVDGAARSAEGSSRGISSAGDRRVFGRLRGLADVVLAGAGTIREEGYRPAKPKPDFAERRAEAGQQPAAAIALVSRSLSLDLTGPLFTAAVEPTIVITCAGADHHARGRVEDVAELIVCGDRDVDLAAAVAALHDRGLSRIHAEGGPHLLAELAAADVLDELLLTVSPLLAGGSYDERTEVLRVLAGAPLPNSPRPLRLAHLLEDDGSLFLRYTTAQVD
jgi:riboflavin biosynthesis pyrimidine reductase